MLEVISNIFIKNYIICINDYIKDTNIKWNENKFLNQINKIQNYKFYLDNFQKDIGYSFNSFSSLSLAIFDKKGIYNKINKNIIIKLNELINLLLDFKINITEKTFNIIKQIENNYNKNCSNLLDSLKYLDNEISTFIWFLHKILENILN